jgi:soluble lytic murein transglycosylase-like protein
MSLGPLQDIVAVRREALKNEPEVVRPEGGRRVFRDLFAASVAGSGTEGSKAARTAEILHLEMMRSAISLDGSLMQTAPPAGGLLSSVLAAYGSEVQKPATPVAEAASPTQASVQETSATPPRAEPAAQGSGSTAIASIISRASRRYGVDEGLIKAVIQVESNFKPTAVSHAGAKGLMQLMPATAAGLGVTDSFNPEQNVMAGTRFLKDMLNRYGGDLDKALAAYNWGPGNLERGKGKLPRETQDYLVKVKKLYANNEVA